MNMLRKYWPDLGMLVAAVTAIGIVMNLRSMSELSMILWLSFIAILVHQFEEYRWPGYFGGLFNIVIFKSEQPTRYPLNPQSAMVINLVIAYVFIFCPSFSQPSSGWHWPRSLWVFSSLSGTVYSPISKPKHGTIPACSPCWFSIFQSEDGICITLQSTSWQAPPTGSSDWCTLSSLCISSLLKGICG